MLTDSNISYEQLLAIVEAVRGHHSLEQLYLYGNGIGNAGCNAIATLLSDPNSNINHIKRFILGFWGMTIFSRDCRHLRLKCRNCVLF